MQVVNTTTTVGVSSNATGISTSPFAAVSTLANPRAYWVLPGTFNSMIFASKAKTHPENLVQNYLHLSSDESTHPLLLSAIETAVHNQQPSPDEGIIMTDDKAPIEWITNKMITQLFFSSDLQNLQ